MVYILIMKRHKLNVNLMVKCIINTLESLKTYSFLFRSWRLKLERYKIRNLQWGKWDTGCSIPRDSKIQIYVTTDRVKYFNKRYESLIIISDTNRWYTTHYLNSKYGYHFKVDIVVANITRPKINAINI